MINTDNIRFNINKSSVDFYEVSKIIFSKDLMGLMEEVDEYGRYGPSNKYEEYLDKLENLFIKICKAITYLQNKDKVRVQVMEETSTDSYKDVKIFINNEIVNRINYTDYNYYRIYFYLMEYYEIPTEENLLEYRKSINK